LVEKICQKCEEDFGYQAPIVLSNFYFKFWTVFCKGILIHVLIGVLHVASTWTSSRSFCKGLPLQVLIAVLHVTSAWTSGLCSSKHFYLKFWLVFCMWHVVELLVGVLQITSTSGSDGCFSS
jgi:hypothetical protein